MAANTIPTFTLTPRVGFGLTSTTSQASLSGTSLTNGTSILTGAATGTKIREIQVTATGTSLVGTVNIFIVDGSNNWILYDQCPIAAQTLTTGTPMTRWNKTYPNLVLPSASYSLQVAQTCAGTQIACAVLALGADF